MDDQTHPTHDIVMDVMIDMVMSKFNCNGNNLVSLKKKLKKSTIASSSATLYYDDKLFLKVFNNDTLANALFKSEKEAYQLLSTIRELEPYVPKLIEFNIPYILIENRGIDGINIINGKENTFTFAIWEKFVVDISSCIRILHNNNICHGDIKPGK